MKKLLILNTGGTFNKVYNEINGLLEVQDNSLKIKEIIKKSYKDNIEFDIKGTVYKDSLDIDDQDRDSILKEVKDFEKVVIVHGTDTMDKTAAYLAKNLKNKLIVLTGAMMPYSIEKVEATANLIQAITFANITEKEGVFISMHGLIDEFQKIKKNKILGKFECQK